MKITCYNSLCWVSVNAKTKQKKSGILQVNAGFQDNKTSGFPGFSGTIGTSGYPLKQKLSLYQEYLSLVIFPSCYQVIAECKI